MNNNQNTNSQTKTNELDKTANQIFDGLNKNTNETVSINANTGKESEVAQTQTQPAVHSEIINEKVKPDIKNPNLTILSKEMNLQDTLSSDHVEVDFDYVKVNNVYYRTLFVGGYPRFVAPGWLEPVVNFNSSLDISFYIYPVSGKSVLDDLRRKIAEMEAELSTDIQRGKIVDPATTAKLEDARALQEQLVKGIERYYEFSFYITIPANNLDELNNVSRQVQSTLGSLLVVAESATLDQRLGFLSTAPYGQDRLAITRNMDTTSVATTFPFTSAELSSDKGILYGINSQNESFIIFDRFSLENGNMTVFATSGAGKSLVRDCEVLYKDKSGAIQKDKIGNIIDAIFKKGNIIRLDKEIEGVLNPEIEVYSFDKELKGHWSNVEVATRKITSPEIYNIKTRSGRKVSITGDHCLVTIKDGSVKEMRGDEVSVGNYLPIPRFTVSSQVKNKWLDTFKLCKKHKPKFLFKEGGRTGIRNHTIGLTIPEKIECSNDFYRLLGYFTAEGMSDNKKVLISSMVPEILTDIKSYLEFLKINYHYAKSGNKVVGIYFNNGPFRLLLKSLGVYGKADKKNVPQLLYSSSVENIANFIKSYFEGDGTVGEHEISATTKSKQLASDLSYLLSYFGIITRIRITKKRATNTVGSRKRNYYLISISGQDNIRKYINNIGFVTKRKNDLASKLLKTSNTNFDIIPELQSTFKEICSELYNSEIPAPKNFSEVKLGIFKPSREKLKKIISGIKNRIYEIESLEGDGISKLSALPTVQQIIDRGSNKRLNTLLWQKLDHSWRTMRNGISPNTKNALVAAKVTHGYDIEIDEVGRALYRSFKFTGESLEKFDSPLWETVLYKHANARYEKLLKARDYITEIFKNKSEKLKKIKEKIAWLETLANSDLYWDEIVKITKVKSKHPYVYDLQVENSVFLAGYGGMFVHNSYFVKTEAVRSLMIGSEVIILDPEAEYKALCDAVGGQYIAFSYNSPAKINPFDLSQVREEGENQLGLKILSLHSLMKVIMGQITPTQEAMLDRALIMTYKAKGITNDPETQTKEPPLMEDLYKTLIGMEVPEALDLASRIEKFIRGSFQGIFDKQTNIDLNNPFTVFSVKDLQDAIRPIIMFMILDYIWTRVKRDIKRRILIVEEAWQMMKYPDTAQFLWSVVKRARKYYLGLTTITQDVEDFLGQDIGKAIVTNSALRLLLKQSPTAIDKLGEIFYLSQGEKQLLMAANVGEGIFFAGPHHAPIRIVASEGEHKLINTKPQDNPTSTMPNMKAWNRQD